jgi:hypothetical protein
MITDALTELHLQRTPISSNANTPTSEQAQYFPDQQQPQPTRYRSPSIGSTASFSSRAAFTANFDVHTMYKIKTSKSSKKLDSFFGEQAPMDICIQEIRKEGLKAMLQSKVPLCFLLYHLLDEYSSENLVSVTSRGCHRLLASTVILFNAVSVLVLLCGSRAV